MARATPLQNAFNAGEISPRALLRTDIDRYQKSAEKLENLIVQVQGGLTRRPGTLDVAGSKDATGATRLMKFEFNAEQAYVLEVGQGYIRFFARGGPILTGGVPLEIATIWNNFDPFKLRWAQSADQIRFVHPDFPPQILSRFSESNWTIADIDFQNGPYLPLNATDTTIRASATFGTIGLFASGPIFEPGHIGSLWRLADATGVLPQQEWIPQNTYTTVVAVRFGSNVYSSLAPGTSGTVAPTHTSGIVSDGGIDWRFAHNGFGHVKIISVTSPTQATGTVQTPGSLPGDLVTTPSANWQEGAWSEIRGFPSAISFFEQRVVYADSREPTLRYSTTGDFDNFSPPGLLANTVSDGPIDGTLDSGQELQIHWMVSRDELLVGTSGGEWTISSSSGGPVTPFDIRARQVTSTRAGNMDAIFVRSSVLFAARGREKLHEMVFDFDSNNYQTPDMTRIADHVLITGLIELAHQQEPESLVWGCLTNGDLVSLSFDKVEQVVAWARHPMPGRAVESVVAIPGSTSSNNEQADEVWLLVNHGDGIRRIERIDEFWRGTDYGDVLDDAYYVDSGVKLNGGLTNVIIGLAHLEGREITVLADGVALGKFEVVAGQVTLPTFATKISAGLPINYFYKATKEESAAPLGTAIGKKRSISEATFSLLDSCEVLVGAIRGSLEPVEPYIDDGDNPLLTGDYRVVFERDWEEDRDPRVIIENDTPCPFTLLAIAVRHRAEDR